jgi:cell division protein FtsN
MAKDYRPRQGGKTGNGLLLGMFIGFVLGLVVAGAIAMFITKSPVPFLERGKPSDKPAPSGQNLKDAPKAALPGDGKPRFDFYRILPGQEEPVSPEQLKQAAAREKAGKAEAEEKGASYFLQAGSFQSPADADNMKAKLAFMGIESSVEPTTIPEKGVFYRVRLGPYAKVDEINRVRSQLAANGVDASLVKVRDPGKAP